MSSWACYLMDKLGGMEKVRRALSNGLVKQQLKTALENQYWLQLGAQVNSMSVGPETILAQEMQIPTVALLVGHKYSRTSQHNSTIQKNHTQAPRHLAMKDMQQSLIGARHTMEKILMVILQNLKPVTFEHYLYKF